MSAIANSACLAGRSDHEMDWLGDQVFKCGKCGHTEIGCRHERTAEINGRETCLLCHEVLGLPIEERP